MDVRQLEIFLAVIETSSVTAAGARVGLSPAAISVQLHNLADDLGADLFVRSGKRLAPTRAALRLAELAEGVVRQMHQIRQEFESDPSADNRPFYFATGATTLINQLGAPLRKLRQAFPQTPIEITVAGTEEMVAGLLSRRFDLAVISLQVANEALRIVPLFDEELLVVKASSTRVRRWHVGAVSPKALESAPFLLYPRGSVMRTIVDNFFREIGITPRVAMEADDAQAIIRLVEAGFGYSVLPEQALRGQSRFCVALRVPGHRILRQQALAMVKTRHPRPLVESITRFLQNELLTSGNGAR